VEAIVARNKYGARKTVVDGLKFDSQREAKRWQELKLLEKAGEITARVRQIVYELAPAVKLHGEARKKPALRYVADFRYITLPDFAYVVEDAKGHETDVARIKRHLMKSVHGIDVRLS
jgi:Xaa-Pro aminopeptidase